MNNKGQSLALFVILLPVIIILMAISIDISYISIEKNKLNNIGETSLYYLLEDNKEVSKVKKLIEKNDKTIKINKINQNEINISKKINSLFGKIIGLETYNIKVNLTGKIEKGKVIIEKGN